MSKPIDANRLAAVLAHHHYGYVAKLGMLGAKEMHMLAPSISCTLAILDDAGFEPFTDEEVAAAQQLLMERAIRPPEDVQKQALEVVRRRKKS